MGAKIRMKTQTITLNMLVNTVFEWAYDNDLDLYKNLDQAFDARKVRHGVTEEQKTYLRESNLLLLNSPKELLAKAIELGDYEDVLNFRFAFCINNDSTNKGHGSYTWKYSSFAPHPYSSLIPIIDQQMLLLDEKGLATCRKSLNEEKHSHFRYWMKEFLKENNYYSLRFFVQSTGNTRCFDTLHLGNNESEGYQLILQYILDYHICPDKHYSKVEVPDFVNPDNYQPRYITSSGRFGGFNYLVYVTAEELQEIYKTKLNKRKLNYLEKAFWGFVNACSKDKETKFYLFLT